MPDIIMTIVNFLNEHYYNTNLILKILIIYYTVSAFIIFSWPNIERGSGRAMYLAIFTILGSALILWPLIVVPLVILYALARLSRYILEKAMNS